MAKRYHQSMKDRIDESRAMGGQHSDKFNDEKHHSKEARGGMMGFSQREEYAGVDGRRHQEMQDAGMIREDRSQVANLPQNVMMKPYPRTGPYMPEGMDDTITGIDDQMDYDDSQRRAHWYPKKV